MKRHPILDRLFLISGLLITLALLNACVDAPDPTTAQATENTSTSTRTEATADTPIVTTAQPMDNTNPSTSITTISIASTGPADNALGQTIATTPSPGVDEFQNPGADYAPRQIIATTTTTTSPPTTTTTTNLALSTEEVPLQVKQISQSVPLIEMAESKRVGILINGGYIVTSFDMPLEWDLIVDQLSIDYYHYGVSLDQSYRFDRVVFPNGEEFENVPLVGWVNLAGLVVLGPVDASAPPLILKNKEELVTESEFYSIGYSAHNYPDPTFTRRVLLYDSSEDEDSWYWYMSFLRTNPAAYEHQIGGPLVNSQGKVVGIYIENKAWAISISSAVPIVEGLVNGCFAVVHRWFLEAESEDALPRLGEYISVLMSTKSTVDLWQAWIEFDCQDKHALDSLGSDYYESLNPGYNVLYAGTFSKPEEAQSTCWELKRRTPDLCYVRRLSQDPQDIEIIYPPKPG